MIANSVLGRLYVYWQNCAVFALLRAIYLPFHRAWPHSRVVRFLERESALERAYQNSLIDRFISALCNFFLRLIASVHRWRANAENNSFFFRIASGSRILNFEFLLGAFILFMFIVPHDYWSNTLAFLGAAGFFLLHVIMAGRGERRAMLPRELGLPFLLFAAACVLGVLPSSARGDSVRVLMFFVAAFLFMWVLAADISSAGKLMRLMGFIYAAVMLTSLYAVAQRIMGVEVSSSFTDLTVNKGVPGRVFSTLDNPNNFAEFLVIFTPLCAAYALNVKNVNLRLPLCLALALPMLALIMTYSRSGWLSIFLAAVIFVYYADKKLIPLLFLLCVVAIPFLPASILIRLASIFNPRDTSASHRLITWSCVLDMLSDKGRWLTGVGLGPQTFKDVFPAYANGAATRGVYHSQMLYLELDLEMGLLGLISFLWMMARNLKLSATRIYRCHDTRVKAVLIACCSVFAGLAVACFFEYIWFYPRVLFAYFILLGILLAAARITDDETEAALQ